MALNEWGFASEISKWWESSFSHSPDWKLHTVRVEESVPGSRQRSDLLLMGDTPVLCGEIRLPDHQNSAPWNFDNLQDASRKAAAHGCRWAFTSDSKTLLLIDTQKPGALITRIVHRVEMDPFSKRQELDAPATLKRIQASWLKALEDIAPIVTGRVAPPGMAPDEIFVNALRELLSAPVAAIRDGLDHGRKDSQPFHDRLVEWLVDDQGMNHDPAKWDQEVSLAAKLTAYVFATRLIFYEALKRSKQELSPLNLPDSVHAPVAIGMLKAAFDNARHVSGDYATLFTWDTVSEYALISNACVPAWTRIIDLIHVFDVNNVGHDILGRLFERLIDPNERYEWGQHYTSSDVVDLMLSFAIPDGTGSVLDPAVGGGTFLVRAYARKKALLPHLSHQELLSGLYGSDVSRFASTIATVNLAMRQLDFTDNYPRVAGTSFFKVEPGVEVMRVPSAGAVPFGMQEDTTIVFADVQALVGNPPYVRLHKLSDERQREARSILARAKAVPVPTKLHKLANLHVYFWLHGAQFLREEGRIAFLTAGEWMDADYGVALQEWLLDNFCIEAFIESGSEPWFSEARVGTVVTIARRCSDAAVREANIVRFVRLRRKLRLLYGNETDEIAHLESVDRLRDRILLLQGVEESDDMDWSTIQQSQLRNLGTASSVSG